MISGARISILLGSAAVAALVVSSAAVNRCRAENDRRLSEWKPVRGIHLLAGNGVAFERLTREVPALAKVGVNWLIVEVNYSFEYRSHPELNEPGDVTREQVSALVKECREHGIRLIPQLQCVGHQSWKQRSGRLLTKYPQLDETPGQFPGNEGIYCRSWCPKHPEVNGIIFALFDELIEAFEADALHVGMDEIFLFASEHCSRCRGADPGDLFAEVLRSLHQHLVKRRGVEMLMWGDRLLSRGETGYSEWNADDLGMHRAIDRIPRDIVICDWIYQKREAYPSLDIFQKKGFRVLSCGWNEVDATEAFVDYALKTRTERYAGHICTVWGARRPGELSTWPPVVAAMKRLEAATGSPAAGRSADDPAPTHVDVFTSGRDGYTMYRIPAVEVAPDGSLVAFAEARKYSGGDPGSEDNDIDLVSKRSIDGGRHWSAMKIVEDPGEKWSAANPATVVDRSNGRMWLHYLRSKPGRSSTTSRPGTDDLRNLARWSDDNGATWSEPIDLSRVARDYDDGTWKVSVVGPGGAVQGRQGRLIAPAWKTPYDVFAVFSEDHGRTWQRGEMIPGEAKGSEAQVVELADGRLLMDIRQADGPHRWLATSTDGGRTWSQPRPGASVTRCACAIERLTLRSAGADRDRILWTGPRGPGRTTLVARLSYDEGETFEAERVISEEKAAYSDLTILDGQRIGVLWERDDYRYITFTAFGLAWLEGR